MHTISYACHTAYVDPLTGEGLIVLPDPEGDMRTVSESLHEADWNAVVDHLASLGWEPTEDDGGGAMYAGTTRDGREVVGLYGLSPVYSAPTLEQCGAALAELAIVADLT